MLTDIQIEAIRATCGKVGVIAYGGHSLVFRRPTRADVREYRRKQDGPEKPDAIDQLAQATLAAFDDEQDPARARVLFSSFLDEYPAFTSNQDKVMPCFAVLTGMVEEEAAAALGKGVSVRSRPPESTPTG